MRTSKAFADQVLEQSHGDYDQALLRAFEAAYSRQPSKAELEIGKRAISDEPDRKEGLRLFVQALMASNDFLYSY